MRNARFREDATRTTLRTECEEPRIGAVHRDTELERQIALESRRIERHEMSTVRIRDQGPNVPEDLWPLQQLLCQGPSRTVERRHEEQPLLRMDRYDSRKEIEVVVHDVRVDGLRRHVNETRPRLPQQEQEEEEALFVRLLAHALNRALEAYRRYNDDGLGILADVIDGAP